jgi:hypothetical protein
MQTLRPDSSFNDGIIFENVEEELPIEEPLTEEVDQPVYVEESSPEEQYHKFLLTQQSAFEAELQKPTEEELEDLEKAEEEAAAGQARPASEMFEESVEDFEEEHGENAATVQAESLFQKSKSVSEEEANAMAQVDNSYSESSEIARIQENGQEEDEGGDGGDADRCEDRSQLGESQRFDLEQEKSKILEFFTAFIELIVFKSN